MNNTVSQVSAERRGGGRRVLGLGWGTRDEGGGGGEEREKGRAHNAISLVPNAAKRLCKKKLSLGGLVGRGDGVSLNGGGGGWEGLFSIVDFFFRDKREIYILFSACPRPRYWFWLATDATKHRLFDWDKYRVWGATPRLCVCVCATWHTARRVLLELGLRPVADAKQQEFWRRCEWGASKPSGDDGHGGGGGGEGRYRGGPLEGETRREVR